MIGDRLLFQALESQPANVTRVYFVCNDFISYFILFFVVVGGDDNNDNVGKSDTLAGLQDSDTYDSGFPNVPTAVSLITQEAATEDVCNDSDPELAKVFT